MARLTHLGIWLLGLSTMTIGCRQYHASPLDPNAHAEAWRQRDVGDEAVGDYARRLAVAGGDQKTDFDTEDGLDIDEAEAVALFFNVDLRVSRLRAKVPLAGAREAGWWEDPQVELEVMRILNRGHGDKWQVDPPSVEGVGADGPEVGPPAISRAEGDKVEDPWIIGVGLSLTIPISGRMGVEEDRAWARYDSAWRRIAVGEWELMTKLRSRWLKWSASLEKISLTSEHLERLAEVMKIAEQLAKAGELKPVGARVFRIEHVSKQSGLRSMEAEAKRQRLEIMAMLGLLPEAPLELVPSLAVPSVDVPPDKRREILRSNHPRMHLARSEYQEAEQQLRLDIRKQYPDLTIGPGYTFEEGQSRLGFGLGMPIPLWNRNRQGIAEALAARDLARTRVEATSEVVVGEMAQAEARMSAARMRGEGLRRDVAPLVDHQITETRKLAALGEMDVLLLRDALTRSLKTKLEIVEATLAEALAAETLRGMLRPRWVAASQAGKDEQ